MKVEDVPQDLKFFKNTLIRDVAYAVDSDGNYHSVISEGWEAKNDALDLTWDNINEECEKIREQVLKGELSPLAFHMEKNLMDVSMLSRYSGFSKKNIKKHLTPEYFNKLEEKILLRYADVLRITVEELKKV